LVTVLTIVMVATPQLLLAVGVSKVRLPTPHSLVLLPAQLIVGGTVETAAIVWLHVLVLPHASVATHLRVATKVFPQPKLVSVLRTDTLTVPQLLLAVGVSNVKFPAPHSLVLLPEQLIAGAVVSTVAIV